MNCDMQKLFIGLMDLSLILLPGALLTYPLMGETGPAVLGDRYATLAGVQAWAALPLRQLSLRPPGFAARLTAERTVRMGPTLHAEHADYADHATRPPWPLLALARLAVKGLAFKGEDSLARAQPFVRQTPVALQVQYFVFITAS